ncbi:hypothetical protein TraAM80_01470 [Trypanosoma rangeli]|uniref:Tetraspanin n=1 Tax=Trypanosoma rangeli TaxID=5698 RepID=A0A3S5ISB7_TRYRA|nr:uncharacterized protein TraAM80_01470 [Trypanosoma rangeli]RNF10545.1 hypothetical protein TraAM80_01470 [Trypanosoma rangeli]|eukprot:RNF10545.1 hypothetical protein TraAM80_01470 [Trypanosoma rangeli]
MDSKEKNESKSSTDSFVGDILRSQSLRDQLRLPLIANREKDDCSHATTTSQGREEPPSAAAVSCGREFSEVAAGGRGEHPLRGSSRTPRSLFGYSLIFINFTFIMASMLLVMSGIVAHDNMAVRLCEPCGYIALSALVFGIILWLFTIFGFMWIRQRQMMFLLVYVGYLVVLFIALFALIIAATVYDRDTQVALMDPAKLMDAWRRGVNDTKADRRYDICFLQQRYNCSGFRDGCCLPGACYNTSDPPKWVETACPVCPSFLPMSPVVCTDVVYSTVRKNLSGFLVISIFSMVLVVVGIIFAFLSRSANRLRMVGEV